MFAVIVDWDTPFPIVILEHQRIIDADPGAPFFRHRVCIKTVSQLFFLKCCVYCGLSSQSSGTLSNPQIVPRGTI